MMIPFTRRDGRSSALACALALATALGLPPAARSASNVVSQAVADEGVGQPLYRANPARTGYVQRGPEPPLALRWKFKTRRGVNEIESFPAVDDGLSSASVLKGVVYVGGHDGWVYALDARTGRKRWEFATKGHVNSTPTPAGDQLFVGSMDKHVYALRLNDGKLAWKFRTGERTFRNISYGGVRSSPVIRDGAVYIGG
jgi:outer membrane protein assembly factor BamB